MSISSKLIDLANCKLAIKTAIEAKTPSIQPGTDLSAWPASIGSIVQLKGETKTANPSTSQQIIVPSSGKNGITQLTLNPVTSSIDANIIAENIKKNINILGVTGTYEGSGGGGGGSPMLYLISRSSDNQIDIIINGVSYALSDAVYNIGGKTVQISNLVDDGANIEVIYADGTAYQYTEDNLPITIDSSQSVAVSIGTYNVCLHGDTLIALADGLQKKISELSLSDKVLSLDPETNEFTSDELTYCDSNEEKRWDNKDVWTFDDGTTITTVHPHEFYNLYAHRFMYIADFKIGDRIYKMDRTSPRLVKHENIKEDVRHFTLFTKKFNNYFANGILTGNRYSSKLEI